MAKPQEKTPRRSAASAFWMRVVGLGLCVLLLAACGKKTPADLLEDAQAAMQRGDSLGAILKCNKILDETPDDEVAQPTRMLLAGIQAQNNNLEEARRLWAEVLDRGGIEGTFGRDAYSARLQSWMHEGNFAEAIAYIEKTSETLKADPLFAWRAQISLAELFRQNKEEEKAIAQFKRAGKTAPNEDAGMAALESLVELYAAKNDYQEPIRLYETYLKEHPETQMRAMVLFGIGHFCNRVAATTEAEDAKAEAKRKANALLAESLELFKKDLTDELVAAQSIVLTRQIAEVQNEMGNTDLALQTLSQGVERYADAKEKYVLMQRLGEINAINGNYEESKRWYTRMRDEYADNEIGQRSAQIVQSIDRHVAELRAQVTSATATTTGTATTALTTATATVPPTATAPAPVAEAKTTATVKAGAGN